MNIEQTISSKNYTKIFEAIEVLSDKQKQSVDDLAFIIGHFCFVYP